MERERPSKSGPASVRLLSIWRWSESLRRRGVRDDGGGAAAGDDCAEISDRSCPRANDREAAFGDAAAEEGDTSYCEETGLVAQASACLVLISLELSEVKRKQAEACATESPPTS